MEEVSIMVEIIKMKHSGCCFNCLLAHRETDIYRIEVEGESVIELCKSRLYVFVKELNEKYSETVGD